MSRAVRAVGIGFALGALVLALAAGVVFSRRGALAEWLLLDRIAARGVAPAALRVTRVDAHGIAIADLALGAPDAPDLAIAEITARWSLAGLRERRLDALRVAGVELRGTQRDGQLSLGALDALLAGDASAGAAPALPASEIAVEAARIRVSTPQGVATGALGGSVQSAADGAIDGEFKLALDGGGLGARGALGVSGSLDAPAFHALLEAEPGLPIAGRVEVRGRIEREQGERVFDATVALRDASFTSDIMRISGVNGVVALRGPPLHTPKKQILSLGVVDVGVPLTEGLVEFTLRRDGTVAVARAMLHFAEGEAAHAGRGARPRREADRSDDAGARPRSQRSARAGGPSRHRGQRNARWRRSAGAHGRVARGEGRRPARGTGRRQDPLHARPRTPARSLRRVPTTSASPSTRSRTSSTRSSKRSSMAICRAR